MHHRLGQHLRLHLPLSRSTSHRPWRRSFPRGVPVDAHTLAGRGRAIDWLPLEKCQLAQVIEVCLDVAIGGKNEENTEALLVINSVLPRNRCLLLPFAQVGFDRKVAHVKLAVPGKNNGFADRATLRLVISREHGEHFGQAECELDAHLADECSVFDIGCRCSDLLKVRHDNHLVVFGQVISTICCDLLGLALNAQVFRRSEVREGFELLEDGVIHESERAEEVKHVEHEIHLALELVMRQDSLQNNVRIGVLLVEVVHPQKLRAIIRVVIFHLAEVFNER
mmetsp:Transcript_38233/g.63211  ORF Transcript_38233/g.63211 Transcript_38233/m.63211 type:complete len:281 (+) Transcript_38233:3569-4411(+)